MATAMRTYSSLAVDTVPINVAMFGSWSSGKTTLVSALLAAAPGRESRDVACGRVAVMGYGTVATTVRAGPGWAASPRYRDETVILIDVPGATASMPPQFVVYRPPAGMTAPVDETTYPIPAQPACGREDVGLTVVRRPRPRFSPLHTGWITLTARCRTTAISSSTDRATSRGGPPAPPASRVRTWSFRTTATADQQSAPFPARCVAQPGRRRRDQVVLCTRARPAHATARTRPPGDAVRRRTNPPATRRITAVAAQRMAAYPRRPSEPAEALHSP